MQWWAINSRLFGTMGDARTIFSLEAFARAHDRGIDVAKTLPRIFAICEAESLRETVRAAVAAERDAVPTSKNPFFKPKSQRF